MCAVMMIPTALRPARRLAGCSLRRALAFLVAYSAVWSLTGLIALPMVALVSWNSLLLALAWIAVGAYQALPATTRHLRSCRALASSAAPVPAGIRYGGSCVAACLPLMIASMATVHQVVLPGWALVLGMAAITGFVMWGKAPRVPMSAVRYSGVAIIALAAVTFAVVGPGPSHGGHASTRAGQPAS
jgi:hypothetical protein